MAAVVGRAAGAAATQRCEPFFFFFSWSRGCRDCLIISAVLTTLLIHHNTNIEIIQRDAINSGDFPIDAVVVVVVHAEDALEGLPILIVGDAALDLMDDAPDDIVITKSLPDGPEGFSLLLDPKDVPAEWSLFFLLLDHDQVSFKESC